MIKINRKAFGKIQLKEERAILLACIGIALVFWLLVKLSQTYRAEKAVLFQFTIPENKAFTKLPPKDMFVELEGTGWDLMFDYFSNRKVSLSYDMQGTERLSLNRAQLRSDIIQNLYSNDIKVTEVNPESVSLALEEKAYKTVPIRVQDSLTFAPEHHLKSPVKLQPDSVEIHGPASAISGVSEWKTDSLRLLGLKTSISKTLPLQKLPPEIQLSIKKVKAIVEVEPYTEKSMYVPLVIKNAPDSLKIFPKKVTVTVKLGLSRYDSVSYRNFTAEIDLKGISPNASNNTVPIVITQKPGFIESMQYTPKSAKYFIVEKPKPEEKGEGPELK